MGSGFSGVRKDDITKMERSFGVTLLFPFFMKNGRHRTCTGPRSTQKTRGFIFLSNNETHQIEKFKVKERKCVDCLMVFRTYT